VWKYDPQKDNPSGLSFMKEKGSCFKVDRNVGNTTTKYVDGGDGHYSWCIFRPDTDTNADYDLP
jgi:hypothetical protein